MSTSVPSLDELQDGQKITNSRIADFIGKSERTIKRRLTEKMGAIKKVYNDSIGTRNKSVNVSESKLKTSRHLILK